MHESSRHQQAESSRHRRDSEAEKRRQRDEDGVKQRERDGSKFKHLPYWICPLTRPLCEHYLDHKLVCWSVHSSVFDVCEVYYAQGVRCVEGVCESVSVVHRVLVEK